VDPTPTGGEITSLGTTRKIIVITSSPISIDLSSNREEPHLLVWLCDLNLVCLELLNATIPWTVPGDACEVVDLQCAQQLSSLPVQVRATHIASRDTGLVLAMQHFVEACQCRVRAHVTSLLGALRCQTNAQASNVGTMLLRYVSSYVAKCHDASTLEALHIPELTGFQAANSFLRTIHQWEQPAMAFALTSMKASWTNCRMKWLVVPTPDMIKSNKEHAKYLRRPERQKDLNFDECLRLHNTTGHNPKLYTTGGTLAGIQCFSVFNPVSFFQQLVCYWPHQNTDDLFHP